MNLETSDSFARRHIGPGPADLQPMLKAVGASSLEGLIVAIDETPVGTFVELEGEESAIASVAARLGRGPADYVLASYRSLFLEFRQARGATGPDMVFDAS